jgi:hypothetical protein
VENPPPAIDGDILHFLLENLKDYLAFIFDALCGNEKRESGNMPKQIDARELFI